MQSLNTTVNLALNVLDIRIPDTIGPSMRMADVVPEMGALAANITFCHLYHLHKKLAT